MPLRILARRSSSRGWMAIGGTGCVALLALTVAGAAVGQEALRPVGNPPLLDIRRAVPQAKTLLSQPAGAAALADEAVLDLHVEFVESQLYNPASGRYDKVRLRGYRGTGIDPKVPYVGPTIAVAPGETVRMTLHNDLPPDTTCESPGGSANIPNCFNGTNMHTHGLWVNPSGNSDNVLISIDPQVSFQYEYNIPPDHPAGTFWYHPHRHGSTALQVASGMAGALIVRGNRVPQGQSNGDLDVLLQPTGEQRFGERILVFQQIQYACRDANGAIKTRTNAAGQVVEWVCDPDDTGTIEGYDQFKPGTWSQSGRFTSINGVIQPLLADTRAGQVERWRMVHAGVRDTISFSIRKHKDKAQDNAAMLGLLSADKHEDYIAEHCTGDELTFFLVAADGLTTGRAIPSKVATFQPGYRWDALVVLPEAGDYCVIDAMAAPAGALDSSAPGRRILGFARAIVGPAVPADPTPYVQAELEKAARAHIRTDAQAQVLADLANGLKLIRFVPHADVAADEVTGTQTLTFNIDVSQQGAAFFEVDGRPYAPGRIDRTLILGTVDEWTLTSDFVSHPFHIHVNPFQIVSIESPKAFGATARVDVATADQPDNFYVVPPPKAGERPDPEVGRIKRGGTVDPQFANLIGVWKDTLWIKSLLSGAELPAGANPDDYKYIVRVRTRYQRYIGDFVLHCHILDHEDQGMMQNVRVTLPDGQGGASHGHH